MEMISYAEASEFLGVPVGTLYAWVHARRIPHIRLGSRMVRFRLDALKEWVATRDVPEGAVPAASNK